MTIHKCDLCGREILGRKDAVIAGVGQMFTGRVFELCISCGKPVRDFLTKNKLIEKEEKGGKAKK